MTVAELGSSNAGLLHANGGRSLKPDDPADDADEELDEQIELPLDTGAPLFDADALKEAELLDREPEYGDLLDSGWIDRAAHIEELDDDESNSLDFALTVDLSDSEHDEDLGQAMDLDVGALLTPLPKESESDRDPARDPWATDASFVAGALHDLLLPDASDGEAEDNDGFDDERFPAFDDAPVPTSSRTGLDDSSDDDEGIANEGA